MRGWWPAAVLFAGIAGAPSAGAQQTTLSAVDFLAAQAPLSLLPRPAETGKPIIYDPQYVAKADRERLLGCTPALMCRMQLLGVIEKNGAVELKGTALTW